MFVEIGVLLILFFAVASMANRRAQRQQATEGREKSGHSKPEPSGPFQQFARQLQESMERAAGIEPDETAKTAWAEAPKAKESAAVKAIEQGFRDSIPDTTDAFQERHAHKGSIPETDDAFHKTRDSRPERVKRQDYKEAARTPQTEAHRIIPHMAPNSLVQAMVTREILARPRSAWRPQRESAQGRAPGA
ncbi:MAG: hypothetical protein PHP02_05855 [Eubacteriales bacterium]|nr:hypothetical protein [Eubacteriales bacterium]